VPRGPPTVLPSYGEDTPAPARGRLPVVGERGGEAGGIGGTHAPPRGVSRPAPRRARSPPGKDACCAMALPSRACVNPAVHRLRGTSPRRRRTRRGCSPPSSARPPRPAPGRPGPGGLRPPAEQECGADRQARGQGPGADHRPPGALHRVERLASSAPRQARQYARDQQAEEDGAGGSYLRVYPGRKGGAELDSAHAAQYEPGSGHLAQGSGTPPIRTAPHPGRQFH
jgi:hypothetical protein